MANLNVKFKTRYGLDWPVGLSEPFIEMNLAKKWMLEPYRHGKLLAPGEHMLRAIRKLLPNDVFNINRWSEAMVHCWCEEDFMVWLGAASCGKSHCAGVLCLLDWLTDPTDTYIAMASTSVPMLKLRSFNSVVVAFRALKRHPDFQVPGKEAPSQTAVVLDGDDGTDATIKASVRGVALAEGNEAKATARLAGCHVPFVTTVLDEGSALPEAAAQARFNAAAGTRRYRFISLANPVSETDQSTIFCEPLDGWNSVDENTFEWRSTFGKVLHFNGFDSPAITEKDGDEKYPFLINKRQIDRMVAECHGNLNHTMIFRMVKGWPAPQGTINTVLNSADIQKFRMSEAPLWHRDEESFVKVAGLDPAFVADGDNCLLQRAKVGRTQEGLFTVAFEEPDYIAIDAASETPATYQVVQQVQEILRVSGIPIQNLAIDDSGTQSVADVVAHETGIQPIRCNFGAKASEEPISAGGRPAKERCKNQVTEIWFLLAELGRHGQVRGFPGKAAQQFCTREFKRGAVPLALCSKADYKKATSHSSPDEADACALACMAARKVAGLVPGSDRPLYVTLGRGFVPQFQGLGTLATALKKGVGAYTKSLDMSRFSRYGGAK